MTDAVFVVGATGRTGVALCRALATAGRGYVPVVRDAMKWRALGVPGERRVVDFADQRSLADTLADAGLIANCIHARYVPALLAATDDRARFVLLGGAGRFAREPDGDGVGIRAGEAAFLVSGRSGLMLHPTWLYGRDSVEALLAAVHRGASLSLPSGGKVRVQPLLLDDLVEAMVVALGRDWAGPRAIEAAGPQALPLRTVLEAIIAAGGRPMPAGGMPALLARLLPGHKPLPPLLVPPEDQDCLPAPLTELLGRPPLTLQQGLARIFG